jgi:hypothetical protein
MKTLLALLLLSADIFAQHYGVCMNGPTPTICTIPPPIKRITVPPIAGLTLAVAVPQLWGLGLVLGNITTLPSATVPVGIVIQSMPLGLVDVGSSVDIVLSSGPAVSGFCPGTLISALPANTSGIACPDGVTAVPLSVFNSSAGSMILAQNVAGCPPNLPAGTVCPAVAALVNLTDPTGVPAGVNVALFSFYTAFNPSPTMPPMAIWHPVTLAAFGNGTPSIP